MFFPPQFAALEKQMLCTNSFANSAISARLSYLPDPGHMSAQ